ncbi:MAG: sensor histidine kinase [Saprospiraceae bacterium]|nr:sensor histidine kinase [Saprospiraceae bacterium]
MFKNLSIRQLTFFVIACISFLYLVFISIHYLLSRYFPSPWLQLLFVFMGLAINVYIVKNVLERFVFRKIKVIYKIIRDAKLTKKEKESVDIGSATFEAVTEDVIEWTRDTQQEIESLKSLEEYRKSYVGNISHELKTPIFSIQGYLHTLLDGGLEDPSINRNYLEKASGNADRLQNIVEDLETISKLESDAVALEFKKFDIKVLTKEIFDDLDKMAWEKQIKLQFKEGASPNTTVNADKDCIRQVMTNLVVNAIKYGREGGSVKVSFYDLESQILIEVSDNGVGIEDKHLKHLFDRFYRVDTSRSRKIGGSGLGLSIVKHILEAHHQTINVRSTLGLGSTFGFTLEKA